LVVFPEAEIIALAAVVDTALVVAAIASEAVEVTASAVAVVIPAAVTPVVGAAATVTTANPQLLSAIGCPRSRF